MKVLPVAVKLNYSTNLIGTSNSACTSKSFRPTSPIDSFEKKIVHKPIFNTVSFMGHNVHILDGGAHGDNMKHFAKAVSSDIDVVMHEVETNPNSPHDKQMKSLYEQLKAINERQYREQSYEYVALPGLCNVPLQNIEDQYRRVMGENIKLTPENIKSNKIKLIGFLKKISDNPSAYREYINYMDPNRQGVEHMYRVITEINELIEKGYKVYVPSGHPEYQSLKWLAGERGRKTELQHFISNGVDKDNSVKGMRGYIQSQGWYDLNLLNLSDAHTVNLKNKDDKDYLYAAYDSTVTDGARGVYNFYPVRGSDGEIKGYSYMDRSTIQYPYNEFPANDEIADISQFVGKKISNVKASSEQLVEFKKLYDTSSSQAKEKFSNVLFDVKDVFTESEIENQKIDLKGRYTDSSLKLFFDLDSANYVTFPNCNCEGSDRPSVLSMWGSCFSIFNAIKKDIEQTEKGEQFYVHGVRSPGPTMGKAHDAVLNLIELAKAAEKNSNYKTAEAHFNNAVNSYEAACSANIPIDIGTTLFYEFANFHLKQKNYDNAKNCFNKYLQLESADLKRERINPDTDERGILTLTEIKNLGSRHVLWRKHVNECEQYNKKSTLYKIFNPRPNFPYKMGLALSQYMYLYEDYQKILKIAKTYGTVADICEKQGETYPARVCRAASKDIKDCTQRGDKIIEKRAEGIQYIGDLFNEIRPN